MIFMYAIMNKRTKKYVTGTDYRKNCQITSVGAMLTYETAALAQNDILRRKCGKDYVVVRIKFTRAPLFKEDEEQIANTKEKWAEMASD